MASSYYTPGTQASITITLASLASSSTLLVGRASTAVTSGNWIDAVVSGVITVGTTPTTNTEIRVYVYAQRNDTPTYPDGITGTDAAKTFATAGTRDASLFLAKRLTVDATTSNEDRDFEFSLVEVCGFLPKRWGVFVTHSTGVNLNATGSNHEIVYLPYTITVV